MNEKFCMTDDPFYTLSHVASATECTGLIPRAEDDDEATNSAALYAIHAREPKA